MGRVPATQSPTLAVPAASKLHEVKRPGVTLLNTAQIYYTSEDCIGLGGKSWAFAVAGVCWKVLELGKKDALTRECCQKRLGLHKCSPRQFAVVFFRGCQSCLQAMCVVS